MILDPDFVEEEIENAKQNNIQLPEEELESLIEQRYNAINNAENLKKYLEKNLNIKVELKFFDIKNDIRCNVTLSKNGLEASLCPESENVINIAKMKLQDLYTTEDEEKFHSSKKSRVKLSINSYLYSYLPKILYLQINRDWWEFITNPAVSTNQIIQIVSEKNIPKEEWFKIQQLRNINFAS